MKKARMLLLVVLAVAIYCAATVGSASGARLPGAYEFGANAWDCDPAEPDACIAARRGPRVDAA
jgi:hypothetical protein